MTRYIELYKRLQSRIQQGLLLCLSNKKNVCFIYKNGLYVITLFLTTIIIFLQYNSHYSDSTVEEITKWHPRYGRLLYYFFQNSFIYFSVSILLLFIHYLLKYPISCLKKRLLEIDMKNVAIFFLIFFGSLVFYCAFYELASMSMNTNFNGVWKASAFSEYKSGNTSAIEIGGILYFPLLKVLVELMGYKHPLEYYKAIVYLSGICSSVTLYIVFLFTKEILSDRKYSLFIVAIHFLCPGIFLLSVSSEDIFPSYMFYVGAVYFFFLYLRSSVSHYLVFSGVFMSFSMLFHWTSGIPAFVSLFAYVIFFDKKNIYVKVSNIFHVLLCSISIFIIVCFSLGVSLQTILYPGKGIGTMWVSGLTFEKIPVIFANTLSFFWLGIGFDTLDIKTVMAVCFLLSISFYYVYVLVKKKKVLYENKYLVRTYLFLILVFIVGSAMNYYEQGNDAQFFLQPQFLFIYVIITIVYVYREISIKANFIMLFPVLAIFLLTLAFRFSQKGMDDAYFKNVEIIEGEIKSIDKTLFIGSGYDDFIPFFMLYWDRKVHFMYFPKGELTELDMTDDEYMDSVAVEVEKYLVAGNEIIMADFINREAKDLGTSFSGYDLTSKIILVQNYFRKNYDFRIIEGTHRFTFFKLSPKVL